MIPAPLGKSLGREGLYDLMTSRINDQNHFATSLKSELIGYADGYLSLK